MCPLIEYSIFFLIKCLCIVNYCFWPTTAMPGGSSSPRILLLSHSALFSGPEFAIPEMPMQSSHLKSYIYAVPSDKWNAQDTTCGTEQNALRFLSSPPQCLPSFPLLFLLSPSFYPWFIRTLKHYSVHCLSVWLYPTYSKLPTLSNVSYFEPI